MKNEIIKIIDNLIEKADKPTLNRKREIPIEEMFYYLKQGMDIGYIRALNDVKNEIKNL